MLGQQQPARHATLVCGRIMDESVTPELDPWSTTAPPPLPCSVFSLKDGKCMAWSESVFGLPGTQGLAGFVGGLGGEKNSPATVYPVSEGEDGMLTLEL